LVNEFALMCSHLGVSVWEVIEAAATKPFDFLPFFPGPGIGGHCIPVDPMYLAWKLRLNGDEARFIALADEVNRSMPAHVVSLVADGLWDLIKQTVIEKIGPRASPCPFRIVILSAASGLAREHYVFNNPDHL
jgi:UDP-N-acetyl-D-mannosaminuronate dehydrogenase